MFNVVERGELYYADLEPSVGSEQGGIRPVLIIQNDMGNYHSPTTIIAALTTKVDRISILPIHYMIQARAGLRKDSTVLLEQVRTIDKSRLLTRIGKLSHDELYEIDEKLKISLSLV